MKLKVSNYEELPNGCKVRKSDGRAGWEWQSPTGFNFYNFATKEEAKTDAVTSKYTR